MALPTWQATGTKAEGTTSGVTPAAPSHVADDILLCFCETGAGLVPPLLTANGYAQLTSSSTGSDTRLTVFWKRATGAGSADPVFDTPANHIVTFIEVYRGCITTGDPWEALATNQNSPATTSVSATNANATSDTDRLVIVASAHDDDPAIPLTSIANAALGAITKRGEVSTTSGNDGSLTVINGSLASAGTIGTTTATANAAHNHANASFALLPSGAAPAGHPTMRRWGGVPGMTPGVPFSGGGRTWSKVHGLYRPNYDIKRAA